MMIAGLLGKKIGMTHLFGSEGRVVPVTVLEVGPCTVTQLRTSSVDGYSAVQIGFGESKTVNSPKRGHLKAAGVTSRHLREFQAKDGSEFHVGQRLVVSEFQEGQLVDVVGISKGRGFAGVVKRHGFAGGPKTHGQGDRHRSPGSIGAGTFFGRVVKGKKMPGHMGDERVTVRGLRVAKVDLDRNLLIVRGAVPGARDGILLIKHSTKKGQIVPLLDPEDEILDVGQGELVVEGAPDALIDTHIGEEEVLEASVPDAEEDKADGVQS
jgi:large subunit ribosomal protein L3